MKEYNCIFMNETCTDCRALKDLYCAKEDVPCKFFKPTKKKSEMKTGENGGDTNVTYD